MGLTASARARRGPAAAAREVPRGTGPVPRLVSNSPPQALRNDVASGQAAARTGRGLAAPGHDFSRIPLSADPPSPVPLRMAASAPLAALERDADRAADQVTFPAATGQGESGQVQRSTLPTARPGQVPPAVDEVRRSPGLALDNTTRAEMESRLGHDFSQVRVHTDARAAVSAGAIGALAYTVGRDVVFAEGAYAPRTPAGTHLLAHELAHVVQQRGYGGPLIQCAPAAHEPAKAPPAKAPPAKSKVKKLTVTKHGNGFDDFEAKRGGGKHLGYHHGWHAGSWYANFRFQVKVDVEGDINTCSYEQMLDRTTTFTNSSGDDTYDELKNRPLKTQEWVKVSGSSVLWLDAPGVTSDLGKKRADLPYSFTGKFTQSATGEDGERVSVAWNVAYELGADEKWKKTTDGLDKSASHS
ncbi:MAG: DUF4157 domain-containing protein [Micromonosporaceae bacterium]